MTTLLKIGACFVIAALASVAYAQTKQPKKEQTFLKASVEALITSLSQNRALFGGNSQSCTIVKDKDPCPVTLTVQPLFDANNNLIACGAAIGDITIHFPLNARKGMRAVIHWTISATPNGPSNATYGFDTTYGLIVLQDNDNATNKKKDSATATDLYMTYTFDHKNEQPVIYYPLVFQSLLGSPAPSLCAAADPQIVNN